VNFLSSQSLVVFCSLLCPQSGDPYVAHSECSINVCKGKLRCHKPLHTICENSKCDRCGKTNFLDVMTFNVVTQCPLSHSFPLFNLQFHLRDFLEVINHVCEQSRNEPPSCCLGILHPKIFVDFFSTT
jgi:hypothetical protein